MNRSSIVSARTNARSVARVGATKEESSFFDTTVNILGIGFGAWLILGVVAPNMLGAATKTKRAYRDLREAGGGSHAGSRAGYQSYHEPRHRQRTGPVILDADFEEDTDAIERHRGSHLYR